MLVFIESRNPESFVQMIGYTNIRSGCYLLYYLNGKQSQLSRLWVQMHADGYCFNDRHVAFQRDVQEAMHTYPTLSPKNAIHHLVTATNNNNNIICTLSMYQYQIQVISRDVKL